MDMEAVFIDRDGTIGGTGHFIHPRDFTLYPFSKQAFKILKDRNIKFFACMNQHRISRGEATIEEFQEEFRSYGFDDAFICPHSKEDVCNCRKPKAGMLLEAAKKHNLDLSKTAFIGDVGSTDMLAAHSAGAIKVLVKTGWGRDSLGQYREGWREVNPDYIAENLLEAVQWIVGNV